MRTGAEIASFPGVSAPYEPPREPDLVLDTDQFSVEECVRRLVELIEQRQFIAT